MDRLDEILELASPLLGRVDETLQAGGAPPGHGVWGELRRVRLLPADACRAVAALRPSAFADAVPELRAAARSCAETAADLPPPGEWSGEAAEAYDDHRRRMASHLSGGDESLDERLEATADLASALAEWMAQTRSRLAAALAGVLTSEAALTLSDIGRPAVAATYGRSASGSVVARSGLMLAAGGDDLQGSAAPALTEVRAAADIGAEVLQVIADSYANAEELVTGSAALTEAVPM